MGHRARLELAGGSVEAVGASDRRDRFAAVVAHVQVQAWSILTLDAKRAVKPAVQALAVDARLELAGGSVEAVGASDRSCGVAK